MGTPYYPPEHERPAWLPPGAIAVRAEDTPSDISLDDEYKPSPERLAHFLGELRALDAREIQTRLDDQNVRLL